MLVSVMQGIKYILLIAIFGLSTGIGILISKSYENRVIELKEFKNILNIMKDTFWSVSIEQSIRCVGFN